MWFTRKQTARAYPKAHICRTNTQFETVALCWHSVSAEKVVWVDKTYKGETCMICERLNEARKNKRRLQRNKQLDAPANQND